MNSGFGSVTSYSASHFASVGQVMPLPVSAIALAFAIAGFPLVTSSTASAAVNVQLITSAHSTVAPGSPVPPLVTVIVALSPPVAVIDTAYGRWIVFTVHATPLAVLHSVNVSDVRVAVTETPFPPV